MLRFTVSKTSVLAGSVVFLSYATVTSMLFAKFALVDHTGVPVSASSDSIQQLWFLAWPAAALKHGWNPFITGQINAPLGANMMNNTSMLILGLLAAPLTWIVGPVATYITLLRVGFTLTASSAALAARCLRLSWPAAWFVGLLVGFSSYRLTVGQVHLFTAFDVTTPWLVVALIRLAERQWSPRKFSIIVGALLSFCGLISIERAARDAFLISVVGLIVIFRESRAHREIRSIIASIIGAGSVALLGLVIPLWYFFFGEHAVLETKHSKAFYQAFSTTIEQLLLPGTGNFLQPFGSVGKGSFLAGGFTNASYFGAALLMLIVYAAWVQRRRTLAVYLAASDLILITLSFGESVRIGTLDVPMPGALLTVLPGLSDVTPSRWINEAIVVTALLIGFALTDTMKRGAPRRRQLITASLALLVIASFVPNKVIDRASAPVDAWFRSPTERQVMAGNPVTLTYPYAYDFFNSAMLDQAVAGLNYRLIGGQAIVPGSPDSGHHIAPLKPLAVFSVFTCSYFGANDASISFQGRAVCPRPRLTASTIAAFRAFVDVNRVRVIVWQRTGADPMTPRTFLRAAFGEGHRDRHGDLEWWRFPEPHSPPRE